MRIRFNSSMPQKHILKVTVSLKRCRSLALKRMAGAALIRDVEDEWQTLHRQGAYEDDYFFISQLFEQSWQPGTMT